MRARVLTRALEDAKALKEPSKDRGKALRAFAVAVERGSKRQVMVLWREICALQDRHVVVLRDRTSAAHCLRALRDRFLGEAFQVPEILDGVDIDEVLRPFWVKEGGDPQDLVARIAATVAVDQDDPLFVDKDGEFPGTVDNTGGTESIPAFIRATLGH